MSKKANFFVTLGLVTFCLVLAITLKSIGDALTIVGSTITPLVAYIFPVAFYLKLHPDKGIFSREKILPILVALLIIVVSVINLANFFINKKN